MSRRRKQPPPARTPHPDPGMELRLQRILDLRASVGRRAKLIAQYRDEISETLDTARGESHIERIKMYLGEVAALHDRITATEAEISRTGENIAALQAEIPADDLAFLS